MTEMRTTTYLPIAVWRLWATRRYNTADIARKLGKPEHEIDRVLHREIERRRLIGAGNKGPQA